MKYGEAASALKYEWADDTDTAANLKASAEMSFTILFLAGAHIGYDNPD